MQIYWDAFLATLGLPYVIVCSLVAALALTGKGTFGAKVRASLQDLFWCTFVAGLINFLYVDVTFRVIAFCILSVGGVAASRFFSPPEQQEGKQSKRPL